MLSINIRVIARGRDATEQIGHTSRTVGGILLSRPQRIIQSGQLNPSVYREFIERTTLDKRLQSATIDLLGIRSGAQIKQVFKGASLLACGD